MNPRIITLFFSLLIFFNIAHALSNQGDDSGNDITIRRPAKSRPRLGAKVLDLERDGIPYEDVIMGNRYIRMRMPFFKGWSRDIATPHESLAMKIVTREGEQRMSFKLYEKGELLPDISLNILKAYTRLLNKEHPYKFKVLNEDDNFIVKNTFFILGKPYRMLDYEYQTPQGPHYVREYIVMTGNETYPLVIIKIEGNEKRLKEKLIPGIIESLRFSELVKA